MVKISIVIPTIEEESVFGIIKELRKKLGKSAEIIVVDKSSDGYYKRLVASGVKVIRQKDIGVENAIMHGLRKSGGDVLATVDADGTHDLSGIFDGIRMVENGSVDLVLGNRLHNLEKGSMSHYIIAGNVVLSWIFSKIYRVSIHDVLTGLFVVRRSAFDGIRDIDPYRAGIAFFAIELARRGYRVKEVNIRYYKRRYGKSKLTKSKIAYGVNVASHLVRQVRDYSPLLIFGGIGIVAIIIGLAIGMTIIVQFLSTGTFDLTGRALIAFMLVVIGVLLFVSGLILDILIEIERQLLRK